MWQRLNRLKWVVGVPLAVVMTLSILAHAWVPEGSGLFINLVTECFGILFTVVYVDWVLDKHEERRWAGANSRVNERVRVMGIAAFSDIRWVMGYDPEIVANVDPDDPGPEILRVSEELVEPTIRYTVESFKDHRWESLMRKLSDIRRGADRLLDRFGRSLSPAQMEALLDLQAQTQAAQTLHRTFPEDFTEASAADPARLGTRETALNLTAEELRKLLEACRKLIEASPLK